MAQLKRDNKRTLAYLSEEHDDVLRSFVDGELDTDQTSTAIALINERGADYGLKYDTAHDWLEKYRSETRAARVLDVMENDEEYESSYESSDDGYASSGD